MLLMYLHLVNSLCYYPMDILKNIKYISLVYFRIVIIYCSLIRDSTLLGQNDIMVLHYTHCVNTRCKSYYLKEPFAMLPSTVITIAALTSKQPPVAVSQ